MSDQSKIEWTDASWNPITGCTEISPGCKNCYAKRFAERWRGIKGHPYEMGFDLTLRPDRLDQPARWRKPRRIFVNSMSDLFHEKINDDFIDSVWWKMMSAEHHIFQVLTKRPTAAKLWWEGTYLWDIHPIPKNVWLGVSVETMRYIDRVDVLRSIPASIRFLSCEPLLGDLGKLDLEGIHWVIVGGESGPGARHMDPDWVRSIRDQCVDAGVPFFFKQHGGVHKKKAGRELDGRTWDEMPEVG